MSLSLGLGLALTRNKGVPANALTLNRQTIRLNGQLITLRRGS